MGKRPLRVDLVMSVKVGKCRVWRQGSWDHRWSNTEHLDLRLERNLEWNEERQAGDLDGQPVCSIHQKGAGDGEKFLDMANPVHCTCTSWTLLFKFNWIR